MEIREATSFDKNLVMEFCKHTFSWGDYIDKVWSSWLNEGNLFLFEKELPVGLCHAFYCIGMRRDSGRDGWFLKDWPWRRLTARRSVRARSARRFGSREFRARLRVSLLCSRRQCGSDGFGREFRESVSVHGERFR